MFGYITSQNEAHVAADEPDNLPFRQSKALLPHAWLRDCSHATKEADRACPSSFPSCGAPVPSSDFGGEGKSRKLGGVLFSQSIYLPAHKVWRRYRIVAYLFTLAGSKSLNNSVSPQQPETQGSPLTLPLCFLSLFFFLFILTFHF
jgi:hypothetical protein